MKKNIIPIVSILIVLVGAAVFLLNKTIGQPIVSNNQEFVTFIPRSKEISFRYPKNWFVEDRSDINPGIEARIIAVLRSFKPNVLVDSPDATGNYFGVQIVKMPNHDRLSLNTWVIGYTKNSPTGPIVLNQFPTAVDGFDAIYNVEEVLGRSSPVIYIDRGEYIYIVGASSLNDEFKPVFEEFMNSFHFLD